MAKISKKDRRRLLIWTLSILAIGAYLSVIAYNYWTQIYENNRIKNELEKQYESLLEAEKDLNSEVIKLQDPDYVAKFAREKYLYSRNGELIIRIAE